MRRDDVNPSADAPAEVRAARDPQQLELLIRTRSYGRVRDLRLELRGDGLILHGQACSYYAKQLAQQAVLEAGGLTLLANEIEVTNN
jgi:hypothetical protein